MKNLEYVRILSNDFPVGAAALTLRTCGSEAVRKERGDGVFQEFGPILRRDDAAWLGGAKV
jgi:hypothetical protein